MTKNKIAYYLCFSMFYFFLNYFFYDVFSISYEIYGFNTLILAIGIVKLVSFILVILYSVIKLKSVVLTSSCVLIQVIPFFLKKNYPLFELHLFLPIILLSLSILFLFISNRLRLGKESG